MEMNLKWNSLLIFMRLKWQTSEKHEIMPIQHIESIEEEELADMAHNPFLGIDMKLTP